MGNGLPPTFDDKVLEPMIESCLKPLPMGKAKVKEGKKMDERSFKGSKAIGKKENLSYAFKDDPIVEKGEMPNSAI